MTFDKLKDVLLKHLPRPLDNGPVVLSKNRLQVIGEGIRLRDVSQFLAELTEQNDFLPEGLPINDLRLKALELYWSSVTDSLALTFTIEWDNASLSINDHFPLQMAAVSFELSAGALRATASVGLHIDDYAVTAMLELPAQFVSAELEPDATTLALLETRGLTRLGAGQALTVRGVSVSAYIPYRHLHLHVELENVFSIGAVHLIQAQGDVDLTLGGDTSVALSATMVIALRHHDDLIIEAQAQVDNHGWQANGSYDAGQHPATIGELLDELTSHHGVNESLPTIIAKLGIAHVGVAMDTHHGTYRVDAVLDWTDGTELIVVLEKTATGFDVSATLTLGEIQFALELESGASSFLAASYDAAGSRGLSLSDLTTAIGADAGGVLDSIDVTAKSLSIVADSRKHALISAAIDAGIDLTRLGELPVLGALLPHDAKLGLTVDPYFLSKNFPVASLTDAVALLPTQSNVPAKPKPGLHLSATLQLGGDPIVLTQTQTGASDPAPPPIPSPPATPGKQASGLEWSDVNVSLGPLHVQRAGRAIKNKRLELALDASITVAGLTLALEGFGAGYEFDTKALHPHLQGAALDIKRGPVEIGGAFLNNQGDFAGSLTIAAKSFALHAIGAFTMIDDTPSIFAFGSLDMPLGGPVFFFVEGLSAGIGVHRTLHMPKIEDLHKFPLITAASDKAAGIEPDNDPMAQLRNLHDYVAPKLGDYFLAVGLKFNSFRLLHCQAVAVVQFGRDFEIDLLGTGSFAVPPELPPAVPALARVEVNLTARFSPDKGEIAVEARIDPRSYVYSPLVHLSGGFAFYAWMHGAHAGDFVLSVGGYSRFYTPKPHYPAVPRIELRFQVTSDVYIKGEAYFALTPSVVMAGGALHAQANIGALHAWCDFALDVLIGWEPFHYMASMHVAIGARWKCFHTTASADLTIWGPDFSGIASVDWWACSFDVPFGAGSLSTPAPISFLKFQHAFLNMEGTQQEIGDKLGINIRQGLLTKQDNTEIIAGAHLELGLSTPIPVTAAQLGSDDATWKAADNVTAPSAKLGMPPMGGSSLGKSQLSITVIHEGKDVSHDFVVTPVISGVPAALWLNAKKVDKSHPPIQAVVGFTLKHGNPVKPSASASMDVGDLQFKPQVHKVMETFVPTDEFRGRPITELPLDDLNALGLDTTNLTALPVRAAAIGESF